LPKIDRGVYPLDGAVQWVVGYWKTKRVNDAENMDQHRKRLLSAQALKAEIDNQVKLKELIPADMIASTLNKVGTAIASQLDGLAPRLASELTNQTETAYVKKIINDETRQLRITIANMLDDLAAVESNSKDNTTATDKDGEPMG
jgi:phage terminase Nu1 subunit (DNA packaging protein)